MVTLRVKMSLIPMKMNLMHFDSVLKTCRCFMRSLSLFWNVSFLPDVWSFTATCCLCAWTTVKTQHQRLKLTLFQTSSLLQVSVQVLLNHSSQWFHSDKRSQLVLPGRLVWSPDINQEMFLQDQRGPADTVHPITAAVRGEFKKLDLLHQRSKVSWGRAWVGTSPYRSRPPWFPPEASSSILPDPKSNTEQWLPSAVQYGGWLRPKVEKN